MSNTKPPNKRPLSSAWDNNPFAAPAAPVEDRLSPDGTLAADPNKLAAGRGFAWWSAGWHLFTNAPGTWIVISAVMALINFGLALIPFIGAVANSLLFPVFDASLMRGSHDLESGKRLTFGHLFTGFQDHLGRLLAIGAIYLIGMIAIFIIAGLFGSVYAVAASNVATVSPKAPALLGGILFGFLMGALLAIPLMMAIWFAPALIALHDLPALEAMKLSFRGCLRNLLPFLLYGLVPIVLTILIALVFGLLSPQRQPVEIFTTTMLTLGWLMVVWVLFWIVITPFLFCSIYASYRDIFISKH
ncbi:MAG: hypothetical protein LBB76_04930 [Azoarcus sp.]|nr:hypothetical protein [Azoarcus sp.]